MCLVCGKMFKWVLHLRSHIEANHCEDLEEEFREVQISEMMGRVEDCAGSKQSTADFLCEVCDWSSDYHFNYHRHSFTHTDKETFDCSYCNKTIEIKKRAVSSTVVKSESAETTQEGSIQQDTATPLRRTRRSGNIPPYLRDEKGVICKPQKKPKPENEEKGRFRLQKRGSGEQPRMFKCEVCGWCSDRHFNFHRHVLRSCCTDKTFTCRYCKREVKANDSKSNYGITSRKCQRCGMMFYTAEAYSEHMKAGCDKLATGKLMCLVCGKTFKWAAHLKSHVEDSHGDDLEAENRDAQVSEMMGRVEDCAPNKSKPQFLCAVCDWSTELHYNFHRHSFTHTENPTFQCSYCNKAIDAVKFHTPKKSPVKTSKDHTEGSVEKKTEGGRHFICESCGFSTSRRDVFTKHRVEHVPEEEREIFCCEMCPYETFYESSLRTHVAGKHDKKESLELTEDMVLCCELCGTHTEDSKDAMVTHKQESCPNRDQDIITLKRLDQISRVDDTYENEQPLDTSEVTPGKVKIASPLQAGRKLKYLSSGVKRRQVFVCELCQFVCLRRWNMVRHKVCQHQKRSVECHLCGFSPRYTSWLVRHYAKSHGVQAPEEILLTIQSHSDKRIKFVDRKKPKRAVNQKKQVCHLCGKPVMASMMKKHLSLVHETGEKKLYRCSMADCDYSSTVYTNFTKHTRTRHSQVKKTTHSCADCGFQSISKRALNAHRMRTHPHPRRSGQDPVQDGRPLPGVQPHRVIPDQLTDSSPTIHPTHPANTGPLRPMAHALPPNSGPSIPHPPASNAGHSHPLPHPPPSNAGEFAGYILALSESMSGQTTTQAPIRPVRQFTSQTTSHPSSGTASHTQSSSNKQTSDMTGYVQPNIIDMSTNRVSALSQGCSEEMKNFHKQCENSGC